MVVQKKACWAGLPAPIKESLQEVGGIEGLRESIPDRAALAETGKKFAALADPLRLTILHALLSQPLCVCVIREILQIADSKLSYHLNVLRQAGFVESEQQGNWIIYRITDAGRAWLLNHP